MGEAAMDVDSVKVRRVVSRAVLWAEANGIVMGAPSTLRPAGEEWKQSFRACSALTHAPFSLYPSPVPKAAFHTAQRLTEKLNLLLHRVCRDSEFLTSALQEVLDFDRFTARLMKVYQDVVVGEFKGQDPSLLECALLRYDYFVTSRTPPRLQQVEMNTISVSFAGLDSKATDLHRYVVDQCEHPERYEIPPNHASRGSAVAIAEAHEHFKQKYHDARRDGGRDGEEASRAEEDVRVLFIVREDEPNLYDQDAIAQQLLSRHHVDMVRLTLAQAHEYGSVRESDRALLIRGHARSAVLGAQERFVVSVAYFRAGYTPDDYPGGDAGVEWRARTLLERSSAVKVPSVAYQLAGTKKIQQLLDAEGGVERFLDEPHDAALVRECFAGQWPTTGKHGEPAVRDAIARPGDFVLKPQREGGGNNIYGEEMARALQRMDLRERSAYILMERIRPLEHDNILVRHGEYRRGACVSELGIFGVFLADDGKVLRNQNAGHLLRTKFSGVDEGGIRAGVAVLDSPNLAEQ